MERSKQNSAGWRENGSIAFPERQRYAAPILMRKRTDARTFREGLEEAVILGKDREISTRVRGTGRHKMSEVSPRGTETEPF